jgi:hypothetical protein
MSKEMYRQGDVLFVRVDRPPKLRPTNTDVVVEGEATGHAHRVKHGSLHADASMWNQPDLYVEAGPKTRIVHEEHGPIALEPGFWKVVRQIEYDERAQRGREIGGPDFRFVKD